ncbi:SgcJ/EcaC family oxidoreductase [Streptomyces ficellus]|uniref:SgcJ/EcaC family oxidoreductase n=1 Tax=Streptomyces ficellus TaxID=1977088 RepID=A0ABT7ZAS5_9ACTN|nr:SgcJ/EcaC family oxidoreductase [Streptomyces ficellus]MDN3296600.1 SgcJ/EcaC family oxidoreductase [Streptomyces ficellus]
MTRKARIRAALVTTTALVTGATVTVGVGAASSDAGARPTKKQIAALFDGWNKALQSGDAETVAARYAKDAVLLPTASPQIRTDRAAIIDYFEHFQDNKPRGEKIRSVINVLDQNSAIDTGLYRFHFTDAKTGEERTVEARYTYAYEKRNGTWLIVNHHSSVLPPAN